MVGMGDRVVRTWAFCTAQAGIELMILLPSHWWEYRFVLPHLAQKYVRLIAEGSTSSCCSCRGLGFGCHNSSTRGLNGLFWPHRVPGLHGMHVSKCGQNTHKIYLKKLFKCFWPSQTLARVEWVVWVCVVSCGNVHRGRDLLVSLPLSS